MIIKDTRYIIKRIIIGVGICLVLGFINSCNVKAYDSNYYKGVNSSYNFNSSVGDSYTYETSNGIYQIKYESDGIYVNGVKYVSSSDYLSRQFVLSNSGTNDYIFIITKSSSRTFFCNNASFNNYPQVIQYFNNSNFFSGIRLNYSNGTYQSTTTLGSTLSLYSGTSVNIYGFNVLMYSNNSYFVGKLDSERSNVPSFSSTINSLGVVKNKNEEQNIIVSYTFSPTFNNFDLNNFTYQYKIGNDNWLNITSNNVSFNVNQNTTVYFRILKKSDNSVVDSQSFTITNILRYNDSVNENYNVKYSSENRAVSDESSVNRIVDTVVVHFEYFPKQSNLKYQYQFVKNGDSLSTWNNMSSQDYDRDYSVNDNGTMYNRILDENDNILYSSTFTVNSIGKLMLDNKVNWYNSLFDKINYGSGLGSIFYLPLKIVQTVSNSYSNSCEPFNFGSLFGTSLYMPCIDIESLIGSTLYHIIDLIFMGFIALSIIRFIVNVYNRIVSLNFEGNDDGSGALFL